MKYIEVYHYIDISIRVLYIVQSKTFAYQNPWTAAEEHPKWRSHSRVHPQPARATESGKKHLLKNKNKIILKIFKNQLNQ